MTDPNDHACDCWSPAELAAIDQTLAEIRDTVRSHVEAHRHFAAACECGPDAQLHAHGHVLISLLDEFSGEDLATIAAMAIWILADPATHL